MEKREHLRVPVSLKVSYLSRGDLVRDLVTDLSPGGLFVRTSRPLEVGTLVDLEISVREEDPPMHVRGQVVWLRDVGPAEGMGIRFTGVMGQVLLEMVESRKKV